MMPPSQTNMFSGQGGRDGGAGDKIVIYTDGGARGNPGPAALGVVVNGKGYGEYLGIRTNNEAEYLALIFALKKARQMLGKEKAKRAELLVHMDSELVVRQMIGQYKISEESLQPLFVQVWNLRLDFKKVDFVHVRREQNAAADKLVNQALDAQG